MHNFIEPLAVASYAEKNSLLTDSENEKNWEKRALKPLGNVLVEY